MAKLQDSVNVYHNVALQATHSERDARTLHQLLGITQAEVSTPAGAVLRKRSRTWSLDSRNFTESPRLSVHIEIVLKVVESVRPRFEASMLIGWEYILLVDWIAEGLNAEVLDRRLIAGMAKLEVPVQFRFHVP